MPVGRAFSREYKAGNKIQKSYNCSLAIPEGEDHRKLDLYSMSNLVHTLLAPRQSHRAWMVDSAVLPHTSQDIHRLKPLEPSTTRVGMLLWDVSHKKKIDPWCGVSIPDPPARMSSKVQRI